MCSIVFRLTGPLCCCSSRAVWHGAACTVFPAKLSCTACTALQSSVRYRTGCGTNPSCTACTACGAKLCLEKYCMSKLACVATAECTEPYFGLQCKLACIASRLQVLIESVQLITAGLGVSTYGAFSAAGGSAGWSSKRLSSGAAVWVCVACLSMVLWVGGWVCLFCVPSVLVCELSQQQQQ